MTIEKTLKNGVVVHSLEIEENFREAQSIFDESEKTEVFDVEVTYNARVSNDFVATYSTKIARHNDFERFYGKFQNEIGDHKRSLSKIASDELGRKRELGEITDEYYSDNYHAVRVHARNTCDCMMCKFRLPTFEEWKTGKYNQTDTRALRFGKVLLKAGFSQTLIDFYSQQIKTEKDVFLTISDLPQHIAGMSYYAETGSWDGYGGTSCQDTRQDFEECYRLAGSVSDDKLFIGMLHDKHDDLEDMTDKLLARTVLRLVHVDDVPCLIATNYYGNNETKDILHNVLIQLSEVDIFSNGIIQGSYDGGTLITEVANGAVEYEKDIDVFINEDYESTETVDCPACTGSGNMDVYVEEFDINSSVTCPGCGGDGTIEQDVEVQIDEYVSATVKIDVLPYAEMYDHEMNSITITVNKRAIDKARQEHMIDSVVVA